MLSFAIIYQAPKRRSGTKRKKPHATNAVAAAAPPEDLIDDERRQEILQVFSDMLQKSRKNSNKSDDNVDDNHLSLSSAKKGLKQLDLEGIKSQEIQLYFGSDDEDDNTDETLEVFLDADMFLRFAAAMTLQKEKSDRAFSLMDGGGKGVVVIEDLQRIAADLGEDLSEEELQEMMDFVDSSGEGLLSPKHFFKIARQVNLK